MSTWNCTTHQNGVSKDTVNPCPWCQIAALEKDKEYWIKQCSRCSDDNVALSKIRSDLEKELEEAQYALNAALIEIRNMRAMYANLPKRDELEEAQADWEGLRDAVMGVDKSPNINRSMVEHYANLHREERDQLRNAVREFVDAVGEDADYYFRITPDGYDKLVKLVK